jgi:hypothetical protein
MKRNKLSTIKKVNVVATPEILTVKQLSNIVGTSINAIYSMTKQQSERTKEAYLDICFPYPDSTSKEDVDTGPVFIVKNKKTLDYILKSKKRKGKKGNNVSHVKPKHSAIKREQTDITAYIKKLFIDNLGRAVKKLFIDNLGRAVNFDASTTTMAKRAEKEFERKGIKLAIENIRDSNHHKNDYKLINLNYFFREIDKWSQLK